MGELEKKIDKIIDSSELIRLAERHFDSESATEMIEELKTNLKNIVSTKPNKEVVQKDVEIIKGLLKWIKAQDIDWGSDLDIIFKPGFNPDEFNPVKR